jgi:hypothetical protein
MNFPISTGSSPCSMYTMGFSSVIERSFQDRATQGIGAN